MLGDLKNLEDKLFLGEALDQFCEKYSVEDVIKQLNKSTKQETRTRIQYYFSKLAQSHHYKQFFAACLTQNTDNKKEFVKYVASEYSQQFYTMLLNKKEEVLHIIESSQTMVPVLLRLVGYEYGIKLVKLFKELYTTYADKFQCLFNPDIRQGLEEGLGLSQGLPSQAVDTVAQMRYFQIVTQIAIIGGQCFTFVSDLLNRALNLYNTNDILLKMAMVQIVSSLGQGAETAKLLRQHKIWKFVQKDISDPDQQFYVKKYLLMLLIDMSNHGFYQFTPKITKDLHQFIKQNIVGKGEYLEAAIDIIAHLFKTVEGVRIVLQNNQIFSRYVAISRVTVDSVKQPYYDSLIAITTIAGNSKQAKQSPKYRMAVNVLNCIGNSSLCTGVTQNLHANSYLSQGLSSFCEWFCSLLKLPFQQAQLKLLQIFINLINIYEVAEQLLQMQEITKYLLKKVAANETNKKLRDRKSQLISGIIMKGEEDWKDLQLSEYSRSLQKLIKNKVPEESVYAIDSL